MSTNLLGDVSDALDDALDLEAALEAVARLNVPAVADFCAIDLLSSEGALARVAVAQVRDAPWARSVDTWFPANAAGEHPIANVLRRGHPEVASDAALTAGWGMAGGGPPAAPAPSSYLIVPLTARGQRLGVLSLVSWTPSHRYRTDDLPLARRLARQLALAVDNRRLWDEFEALLTTLSHELRTPLTAMMGWVALLRSQDLSSAQVSRGLDVLERNTRLQARRLDDLLELIRLRSSGATLEERPVDIAEVVRDALALVEPEAAAKAIQVIADFVSPSACVAGDASRLRQMVASLVSLAISEAPPGGSIAVALTQPVASTVCLTVHRVDGGAPPPAAGPVSTGGRVAGTRPCRSVGVGLILARARGRAARRTARDRR